MQPGVAFAIASRRLATLADWRVPRRRCRGLPKILTCESAASVWICSSILVNRRPDCAAGAGGAAVTVYDRGPAVIGGDFVGIVIRLGHFTLGPSHFNEKVVFDVHEGQ